jgi:hypothetical protein
MAFAVFAAFIAFAAFTSCWLLPIPNKQTNIGSINKNRFTLSIFSFSPYLTLN